MLRLTTEQSLNRLGDTLLAFVLIYSLFLIATKSSPATEILWLLVALGVAGAILAFNETLVLLYMQHRERRRHR